MTSGTGLALALEPAAAEDEGEEEEEQPARAIAPMAAVAAIMRVLLRRFERIMGWSLAAFGDAGVTPRLMTGEEQDINWS
jgi:hypothetical protein